MVFGIKVRFLFMLVTANLKASSSTLMGSFSSVSKMPPVGGEETGVVRALASLYHTVVVTEKLLIE